VALCCWEGESHLCHGKLKLGETGRPLVTDMWSWQPRVISWDPLQLTLSVSPLALVSDIN
jgi:hypothetical protein